MERPFIVHDYDGHAHRFADITKAIELARSYAVNTWDGSNMWSLKDERTDSRLIVSPAGLRASYIPPLLDGEGSVWRVYEPGHPLDGQLVTLIRCTGRVGGLGGGGAWVVTREDGTEGAISVYTGALLVTATPYFAAAAS